MADLRGLIGWRLATAAEMTVKCSALASGVVAHGTLVETSKAVAEPRA